MIIQGRFPAHGVLNTLTRSPMDDLESFFNELKDHYSKERQNFPWSWEDINKSCNSDSKPQTSHDFVYYIAYNLGKNILHGPLPSHLHSRMIFDKNMWSERYVRFLEGE
jgi:hypothetical protein